jgi:hypothetical protein
LENDKETPDMTSAKQRVEEIPTELIRRALRFYEGYPDGQYDADVVVPILWLELRRRDTAEEEGLTGQSKTLPGYGD